MPDGLRPKTLWRLTLPVLAIVAIVGISFGVMRLRSASPSVERSALQFVTVETGSLVCRAEGLGTLVPEEVRWLSAGTDGRVDQVFLRPGAHVKPDTVILQLSNPDLNRQIIDAELSMKKSEAELAARVAHIDPNVQNGTISIDLRFSGQQPREARSDLSASGSIDTERIPHATIVKWPLQTHSDALLTVYRVSPDGKEAQRVQVALGRVSNDSVQISQGLQPGDSIIVSDMSQWNHYDHLQLK